MGESHGRVEKMARGDRDEVVTNYHEPNDALKGLATKEAYFLRVKAQAGPAEKKLQGILCYPWDDLKPKASADALKTDTWRFFFRFHPL